MLKVTHTTPCCLSLREVSIFVVYVPFLQSSLLLPGERGIFNLSLTNCLGLKKKKCNILVRCNLHSISTRAFKYTVLRMLRNAFLCVVTALNIEHVFITPNDRKSLLLPINLCRFPGNYSPPFCLLCVWSQKNTDLNFGF